MTVSLVTYRHRPEDIRPVVDAVKASTNVEKFIVVDNTVVNRGFGAAHNIAIRQAMESGTKYHAIVNPDISFDPGTLEALESFMDLNPDIGLVMPKTVNPDGSLQYNCKLVPTPFDLFARRFLPKAWTRRCNDRFTMHDADYTKVMDVPYLCGCFMVFRLDCLKEVGLFDERFFMYPEDIDITRRIYASRWRSVYFPGATVVHAHAAASYHNLRMLVIHVWNLIKYFNKWGWFFDAERRRINRGFRNSCTTLGKGD